MKNSKSKQEIGYNDKDEKNIQFILESRLRLQSIQRYLDEHKILQRDFNYFKSKEFVKEHFMKWEPYQRKHFLEKMVGTDYWKKFGEMLTKE